MKAFKKCTCCEKEWENLIDVVRDEQVHIIGYQPAFSDSYEGLFFFAHRAAECGTTIAIPARHFMTLHDGPEYTENMANSDKCSGLCKTFFDFGECSNECNMRWVRDIIKVLRNRGPEELLARLDEASLQQHCA